MDIVSCIDGSQGVTSRPRRTAPDHHPKVPVLAVPRALLGGSYIITRPPSTASDLAGDERGLVAGEERDGVGDLLGRAEPAERRRGRDLGLERLGQVLRELGQDEARARRRCR